MEKMYIVEVHVIRKELTCTNSGFAKQVDKKTDTFTRVIQHPTVLNRFMNLLIKVLDKAV